MGMKNQAMIEVRVARKVSEALEICTFELVPVSGSNLPPFTAGSHIDVEVTPGIVRQYSLCNDSREAHRYVIGVLRDPNTRGGSATMHDRVHEGDVIRISQPRNHFPIAQDAKRSLLLAGGIGVTPILCMAERLIVIGADFEMHYCTRSPERTAFSDRILASAFSDMVHFHHDNGDAWQRLDIPALLDAPSDDLHLYVCGPGGFLDFVLSTAKDKGWSEANVHFEYFAGKSADISDDSAFQIKIASTGRVIPVAAQQSVIEALAAAGVEIPVSCEQGVCGTCITRVLEGQVDHRDVYFTDAEKARNDQFTPCCSRARSSLLVLDL